MSSAAGQSRHLAPWLGLPLIAWSLAGLPLPGRAAAPEPEAASAEGAATEDAAHAGLGAATSAEQAASADGAHAGQAASADAAHAGQDASADAAQAGQDASADGAHVGQDASADGAHAGQDASADAAHPGQAEDQGAVPTAAFPLCPPFLDPRAGSRPEDELAGRAFDEPSVVLPADPLEPVSKDSTSSGRANKGRLLRPVALELRGPHHRIIAGREARRFGTVELIAAIHAAAEAVGSRHPGSRLGVGNLSAHRGGGIVVSVSHQSGRDVDLLFFARDARTGRPLPQPDRFVIYGADGRSRDGKLIFDVERNWTVVAALVMDPARVQWIFVSEPLRDLLLEEGRRRGAPAEVLARAEQVLRQPLGSLPHNNHFHVRIHCAPDDSLDDCRDFGPRRAWAPLPRRALAQRVAALRDLLADAGAGRKQRLGALERLAVLGDRDSSAIPPIIALLGEQDLELVVPALTALQTLAAPEATPAVARLLQPGAPLPLLAVGLETLEAIGDPRPDQALLGLARDDRLLPYAGAGWRRRAGTAITVATRALEVLAELAPPAAVPGLAALLDEPKLPRRVRSACLAALARITNRTDPGARPGERPGQAWARWWEEHGKEERGQWLVSGMIQAGYPLEADPCAVTNVPQLTLALDDTRAHVNRNARDMLRAIVNMPPWRPTEKPLTPGFWRNWWAYVGEPVARLSAAEQRSGTGAGEEESGPGGPAASGEVAGSREQP